MSIATFGRLIHTLLCDSVNYTIVVRGEKKFGFKKRAAFWVGIWIRKSPKKAKRISNVDSLIILPNISTAHFKIAKQECQEKCGEVEKRW